MGRVFKGSLDARTNCAILHIVDFVGPRGRALAALLCIVVIAGCAKPAEIIRVTSSDTSQCQSERISASLQSHLYKIGTGLGRSSVEVALGEWAQDLWQILIENPNIIGCTATIDVVHPFTDTIDFPAQFKVAFIGDRLCVNHWNFSASERLSNELSVYYESRPWKYTKQPQSPYPNVTYRKFMPICFGKTGSIEGYLKDDI